MNKAELTGRLTDDVKLHHTKKSNTPVTTFDLAVDQPFISKDGKRHADFPVVTVWNKSAEVLDKYAGKGSLIGITGQTRTRHYQNKKGETVYVQEIVADRGGMELLDTRSHGRTDKPSKDLDDKVNTMGDDDDDLPF